MTLGTTLREDDIYIHIISVILYERNYVES